MSIALTSLLPLPVYASCGINLSDAAGKFSEAAVACAPAGTPLVAKPATVAAIDPVNLPVSVTIPMVTAPAPPALVRPPRPAAQRPYDAMIQRIARAHRIDPRLLASIVRTESAGRSSAVSRKGALGLMQVMPGTAKALGVVDPRQLLSDPELAITTGARYLKQLQEQLGDDVALVLAAYNAGPGAVAKAGGIPAYRETQTYVATIMDRYRQLLTSGR